MPNRLADAASPYLLQHQDNPVDWYEWGEEAFAEARRRDVPLLLSVGYAACHWCHVMAHESFEDPTTAEDMNRLFVNVKVDREERPDVDTIYMEAVQAMTGRGGWPMTVWIDHDGRPFYAGTYFPNTPRHGMASFREVLAAVSSSWENQRDVVAEQAEKLVEAITREIPSSDLPGAEGLRRAYEQIAATFDTDHGGFGGAPKFPQQSVLEFLLRVKDEEWATRAGEMLNKTLEEMAAGGIYDQIGGGFARYSVDRHWLVPHFEKMLYDNAQLVRLYLWVGIEHSRPDFIDVARSTLDYMIRDVRHSEGGFYSSEDADSEGVEGKFYVWTVEELAAVLGEKAGEISEYFGVSRRGNFEGTNILNVVGDTPPTELASAKKVLLEARSKRVRPGLDDKVIASWNGLAIRAFAETGAALGDDSLVQTAEDAARFVLDNLVVDGRLMRSWRDGRTSVPGFLDDHSSMALGLFSLFAATGHVEWYDDAMWMVNELDRFANPGGGFFGTSDDGETLVKRPNDSTDNPLPSGNALAAEALLIASLYTGDQGTLSKAESALGSVALLMRQYPSMVAHHLSALYSSRRTKELAIVGPDWQDLASVYWSRYRPHVALAPANEATDSVPLLANRSADGTLAYVCQGFVCELPTSDPDLLANQLDR
ncbi:MAG: thioredoxin domain-containing protein [Acidimicrobiia bacterium]